MKRIALLAGSLLLACPAPAAAHRLDEYLQASRISLARDRVEVEIDLTPGVNVAPQVVAFIDGDGDGALSPAERQGYAALVVRLVELEVDGSPAPLMLAGSEFPSLDEMRAGGGTIHLRARAAIPGPSTGRHELAYSNVHHPELSAYLINALAPPSGVEIRSQQRDPWQRQLRLVYVSGSPLERAWRLTGTLTFAALAVGIPAWLRSAARGRSPLRWTQNDGR